MGNFSGVSFQARSVSEAREGENSPITTCYVNIALGCFYFRHKWNGGGGWNGMSFCIWGVV